MKNILFFFFLIFLSGSFAQKTQVFGTVWDAEKGIAMPYVKVNFKNTKIGVVTDSLGKYYIESYYASDSIEFSAYGYLTLSVAIQKDQSQEVNMRMLTSYKKMEEVVITVSSESPAVKLHKRIIAHKDINNKEKLVSYEYENYNKFQLDLNNLGPNFENRELVKRLDLLLNYLDTAENSTKFLPALLSESISKFYYLKNPKKKKEILEATRVTGIENLQFNQFLGQMYFDINIYDNNVNILNRSFVSPISNIARSYYDFYLKDSTFIGDNWCYKLDFIPKRVGDMTFEGTMWVHDTTYAIKEITAKISPEANINYVNDLYFEHSFDQIEPEVWMLTKEKIIIDVKIVEDTKLYGVYARKTSTRKNFLINKPHEVEFYNSDNTVNISDSAALRNEAYWNENRHEDLSNQEAGIIEMVDSLNTLPFFNKLRNVTYFLSTGYYPLGKIEIGNAFSLLSINPVEKFRAALAIRTSNAFSRRLELGGKLAYGFGDEKLKYGLLIRYNITPKKRGMLSLYYSKDIEQIGQSPTAAAVGSTFSSIFRTGPLDKLTMVSKIGFNLEKDIKKDFIFFGGFEWKEYIPLGKANYVKFSSSTGVFDTLNKITTSEFIARIRWAKNEEFIGGSFDRSSVGTRYPILSLQGIFGIKDLFGGNYSYQKIEFQMEHNIPIGILGRLRYGISAGSVFGTTAYPFLKVHEGSQSYWLYTNAFNRMSFFEFISDQYIGAFIENHWEGLLFDRLPYINRLKLRLVSSGRIIYGSISKRHTAEMLLPVDTKSFDKIPYAEATIGIENIAKILRVDLVWRITHLTPEIHPLSIRARWSFNL
jgi:hypothetical protein